MRLLFRTDPEYPQQLKAIADPPYLLYYAGRLSCLERPMVAVVGTRQPSAYGQEMACVIAQGLCDAGVCVVSGLARGIDAAAHKGALAVGGHTAGVLGSGINVPYPSEHTPLASQNRRRNRSGSQRIPVGRGTCRLPFSPPQPHHLRA